MIYNNLKYYIIDVADYDSKRTQDVGNGKDKRADIVDSALIRGKFQQTRMNNVRKSLDGTKFVVKAQPGIKSSYIDSSLSAAKVSHTSYTHQEVLEIMNGPEWTREEVL